LAWTAFICKLSWLLHKVISKWTGCWMFSNMEIPQSLWGEAIAWRLGDSKIVLQDQGTHSHHCCIHSIWDRQSGDSDGILNIARLW
jgi:hypothetical protein